MRQVCVFWFFAIYIFFCYFHLYMFLVYIVGFPIHIFWSADVGLVRPPGVEPFQRRQGGDGGIDANLPGHLEHLTAQVMGARMNEIPIG